MTSKILNEGTALGMEQGRWVEGEGEGVEKQEEEKRENLHLLYASAAFSFPARSWRWAGGHSGGGASYPSGILPLACTLMIIKDGTPVSC